MKNSKIQKMVIAALLCAIGVIIPMFSPIKLVLEPASFTLASHVAIMIAMFVSPTVAVFVSLGTTLGFLMAGFPIVVVVRAFSQVVWAFGGAYYLMKKSETMKSLPKMIVFFFVISLIHGGLEMISVCPFYFGNNLGAGYYNKGFVYAVLGLVGGGTVVHGMVDFAISVVVYKALLSIRSIKAVCQVKEVFTSDDHVAKAVTQ